MAWDSSQAGPVEPAGQGSGHLPGARRRHLRLVFLQELQRRQLRRPGHRHAPLRRLLRRAGQVRLHTRVDEAGPPRGRWRARQSRRATAAATPMARPQAGADQAHQHRRRRTGRSRRSAERRCAGASSPSTPAPPGVRSRAIFPGGPAATVPSYREFTQHYPQPGWVEHDAEEIWDGGRRHARRRRRAGRRGERSPRSGSPTSARRSSPGTAAPASRTARAIVWQDRRTAARCDALAAAGALPVSREITGLVLDPYFSARRSSGCWPTATIDRRRRPGDRHDRQLADLEAHRRRGPRHRPVERQPHDAVRHRARSHGRRRCADLLGVPLDALPDGAARRAGASA